MRKWVIIFVVVLALAGGGLYWWMSTAKQRAEAAAREAAARAAAAAAAARAKELTNFSESLGGVGGFFGSLVPGFAGIGQAIGKGIGDLTGPIFLGQPATPGR